MLVDHPDAGGHRIARSLKFLDDTVQQDVAFVGGVQSVQDIHQSRLAGAIFAQQAVDFSGFDHEVDVVIRNERPESLRDAAEFQLH